MTIRRKEPNNFIIWFPKLSVITFVFSLFAFLAPDISKILEGSPLLFNFFFGVLILAVLVIAWNKNKLSGITFIILGIIYAFMTWDKILAVNIISTSFWLILTGILYLVADKNKLSSQKLAVKKIDRNQ